MFPDPCDPTTDPAERDLEFSQRQDVRHAAHTDRNVAAKKRDGGFGRDDPGDARLIAAIGHRDGSAIRAVDMARALLQQSDDSGFVGRAQAVIDTQEAEITAMKVMLALLGHPVEERM